MHFNPATVVLMTFATYIKIRSAHCDLFLKCQKLVPKISPKLHDSSQIICNRASKIPNYSNSSVLKKACFKMGVTVTFSHNVLNLVKIDELTKQLRQE